MSTTSSTQLKKHHLFSVFVGHLAKDVTKTHLYNLFHQCGEPQDIFVAESEDTCNYNYGFVRFTNQKSCKKAVQELHLWPFHGNRLIVDFAKDTRERITPEKSANSSAQNDKDSPPSKKEKFQSRTYFNDLMRLGHLKESCIGTNIDLVQQNSGNKSSGNLHHLLDDICKIQPDFANTIDGVVVDDDLQLKNLGQKLLNNEYKTNCHDTSSITTQEFFSALQDIMSTINSFVQSEKDKPLISLSSDDDNTNRIEAPIEEERVVLSDREDTVGPVIASSNQNNVTPSVLAFFSAAREAVIPNDSAAKERHVSSSGLVLKHTSKRCTVSDKQNVTSVSRDGESATRIHVPAAPTVGSALSDSSSLSKFKKHSSSDYNCSLRRCNELYSVISSKPVAVTPHSHSDNTARGHTDSVGKTPELQQMAYEFATSNRVSSGLKDVASVSSHRYLPADYEKAASDHVTSDSSDSDCQYGDSGVDCDSLPNSSRLETANDANPFAVLLQVQSPAENTNNNSNAMSGISRENKVIEMYLKTGEYFRLVVEGEEMKLVPPLLAWRATPQLHDVFLRSSLVSSS